MAFVDRNASETCAAPDLCVWVALSVNPVVVGSPTSVVLDTAEVVEAITTAGVFGIELVLLPKTRAVPLGSMLIFVPLMVMTPPGVNVVPGPRIYEV